MHPRERTGLAPHRVSFFFACPSTVHVVVAINQCLPTRVLQWRWIVERTFAWLNRSRRLSKDFEALPETTEAWIRIAMIQLMVRRLAAKI